MYTFDFYYTDSEHNILCEGITKAVYKSGQAIVSGEEILSHQFPIGVNHVLYLYAEDRTHVIHLENTKYIVIRKD